MSFLYSPHLFLQSAQSGVTPFFYSLKFNPERGLTSFLCSLDLFPQSVQSSITPFLRSAEFGSSFGGECWLALSRTLNGLTVLCIHCRDSAI